MAFTNANLHLRAGAPGDLTYTYDAAADTMAAVAAVGFFNNTDDDTNFFAEDLIWCQCTDGNMWLRVASVSSGSVTTQHAGGNLPLGVLATNTNTATTAVGASAELSAVLKTSMIIEDGSSHSSASRYVLPTPYAGAEIIVRRDDSGSALHTYDAGGSAGTDENAGTGVTYDSVGNRRFTIQRESEGFHVVGVSTTRWRIQSMNLHSSIAASVTANAGPARFLGAT